MPLKLKNRRWVSSMAVHIACLYTCHIENKSEKIELLFSLLKHFDNGTLIQKDSILVKIIECMLTFAGFSILCYKGTLKTNMQQCMELKMKISKIAERFV